MKQAKLALTAVAVLAVIGGALAFKANQGTNPFYIKSTALNCTVLTNIPYASVPGGTFTTKAATTQVIGDCPSTVLRELL